MYNFRTMSGIVIVIAHIFIIRNKKRIKMWTKETTELLLSYSYERWKMKTKRWKICSVNNRRWKRNFFIFWFSSFIFRLAEKPLVWTGLKTMFYYSIFYANVRFYHFISNSQDCNEVLIGHDSRSFNNPNFR
jgi:hypothetical protein